MEAYGAAGSIAEEVLSSIRTVVAFDGQNKEITRYEKHLQSAKKNNITKSLFSGISNGFMWFFLFASYALSFWYGVGLILEEKYLPEDQIIYTPANMVSVCVTFIQEILSFITFIQGFLLYFNCFV
jgi:ATP-binding cassette subfamily B (MDR/TAP) protein 1